MKKRPTPLPGDLLYPLELPRSAEEIDLDRLVWDPAYRRAVRPIIEKEGRTVPGKSSVREANRRP